MRAPPCHNFIDFHFKDYNPLFGPTHIALTSNRTDFLAFLQRNIGQNNLAAKAVSAFQNTSKESFKAKNPSLMYFINSNNLNGEINGLTNKLLTSYSVYSIADRACQFFILGAIHRCIQIVSISLHNKVQITHLNPYVKFFYTTAISAIPMIAMYCLGYSAWELVVAAAIRTISSYFFPTKLGSKIREIDLISDGKYFDINNLRFKNILSFTRNLVTTSLIDITGSVLISNYGLISDNPLTNRDKASLGYCVIGNTVTAFSKNTITVQTFLLNLIFTEIGWSLGRLLIDSGIGLLGKLDIICDLRDPFYRYSIANTVAQSPSDNRTAMLKPKPKTAVNQVKPSYDESEATTSVTRKSVKKKQLDSESSASTEQTQTNAVPSAQRQSISPISIDGYEDQKLHPFLLNRQVENSVVFGVIAHATTHFKAFSSTLSNTTYVGPNAKVEALNAHKGVYAVRNVGADERLLGKMVEGEQAVYEAFSNIYGYERTLATLERMRANDLPLRAIIFSQETDHTNLNKVAQRLAR